MTHPAEAQAVLHQLCDTKNPPTLSLEMPSTSSEQPKSPAAQRAEGLLTEESEVFRQAKTLEVSDEHHSPVHTSPTLDDEDKSGDELRQEILEATRTAVN